MWRIRLISGRPRQFPEVFAFIDGTEPDSASNLIQQLAQINSGSASGKLNFHAFAAMAEFERKLIRACNAAKLRVRVAAGKAGSRDLRMPRISRVSKAGRGAQTATSRERPLPGRTTFVGQRFSIRSGQYSWGGQ